jgi:hypothetical protein
VAALLGVDGGDQARDVGRRLVGRGLRAERDAAAAASVVLAANVRSSPR